MARIGKFIASLYRDGYAVLAIIAPLLSITFTLGKRFDITSVLRNFSYAWAVLPLVIWLFIAYLRRWLAHEQQETEQPKLTISRVLVVSSGLRPLPAISISFTIVNPGSPTIFHDWELWVTPPEAQSVGVKITARLGPDVDDLRTKPLEMGGRREGALELFHYLLPYDAMQKPGTLFSIRVLDVKGREIKADHTFNSVEQEMTRNLSTHTRSKEH